MDGREWDNIVVIVDSGLSGARYLDTIGREMWRELEYRLGGWV